MDFKQYLHQLKIHITVLSILLRLSESYERKPKSNFNCRETPSLIFCQPFALEQIGPSTQPLLVLCYIGLYTPLSSWRTGNAFDQHRARVRSSVPWHIFMERRACLAMSFEGTRPRFSTFFFCAHVALSVTSYINA